MRSLAILPPRNFATPISPRILHPKSQEFHQLLSFTSSLNVVGEIWKRRFQSENASNVFCPHYAGGILKRDDHRSFWICVWGKLGQGHHVIIVTSSFSKTALLSFLKCSTSRAKTQSRRFRIPPVWIEERFRKCTWPEAKSAFITMPSYPYFRVHLKKVVGIESQKVPEWWIICE